MTTFVLPNLPTLRMAVAVKEPTMYPAIYGLIINMSRTGVDVTYTEAWFGLFTGFI
jgi:hypothetical protein